MIKIFGARCLVKEIKKESDKTQSGIIIPGSNKQPTYEGIVIKVGDGAMLENGEKVPMNVKIGDRIIYTSFSGTPVKDKEAGEEYLILNERDILCIIE